MRRRYLSPEEVARLIRHLHDATAEFPLGTTITGSFPSTSLPIEIQSQRLALFLDSYGNAPESKEIVETLTIRLEVLIEFTADQALKGDRERRELLKVYLLIYERDLAYIVENGAALGSG